MAYIYRVEVYPQSAEAISTDGALKDAFQSQLNNLSAHDGYRVVSSLPAGNGRILLILEAEL